MATSRFVLPTGERISLTARQLDILARLADGDSNKEMAAAEGLGYSTVKNYLTTLFEILRVRTRTEAVIVAMWAGIVWPPLPNYAADRPTHEERLRAATRKRAA